MGHTGETVRHVKNSVESTCYTVRMKQTLPDLVAFDIDQTLTDTKTPIDAEMAELVSRLIERTNVAIVSGAPLSQCQTQVAERLALSQENRGHLFLIPTNGAALFMHGDSPNGWRAVYEETLNEAEKKKIFDAFDRVLSKAGFPTAPPDPSFGPILEDRGSQVTFSGIGANAPISLKREWDPDFKKRKQLVALLSPLLSDFSISMGGTTSIDITKSGITKALGLFRLIRYLDIHPEDVLYVGDALFPGGNDASLGSLGVQTLSVSASGLDDTQEAIRGLLELER